MWLSHQGAYENQMTVPMKEISQTTKAILNLFNNLEALFVSSLVPSGQAEYRLSIREILQFNN
jgi:hypothetical protein